jgi:hypothetical protein
MISLFSEHAGFKTEYLRRKCFFFFFKKERKKGTGRGQASKAGGKKEGENLPHHCSQGHRHQCGAGAGKEPLIWSSSWGN